MQNCSRACTTRYTHGYEYDNLLAGCLTVLCSNRQNPNQESNALFNLNSNIPNV